MGWIRLILVVFLTRGIDSLKIIIVGAGGVGFHIAGHLSRENKEVVIIDRDPGALRRVSDNLDVQAVEGSGSSPMVLEAAGIQDAEIILAVTDSDEANLVACLVANILSPSTKKLARVRHGDSSLHPGSRRSAELRGSRWRAGAVCW